MTWSITLAARERPRSIRASSLETAWFFDSTVASMRWFLLDEVWLDGEGKWQQPTDVESPAALVDRVIGMETEARLSDTVIAAPRTSASMMFVASAMRAPAHTRTGRTSAGFGSCHGFEFHGSEGRRRCGSGVLPLEQGQLHREVS